jgi:hypothetical protein
VGWGPIAFDFVEAYVSGRPFNFSATSAAIQPGNPVTEANDGRTTEDCLFLDVIVPRTIIDAAQKSETKQGQSEGAAVLVWIYVSPVFEVYHERHLRQDIDSST